MIASLLFYLVVIAVFVFFLFCFIKLMPQFRFANQLIRQRKKELSAKPLQLTRWDFTTEIPQVVVEKIDPITVIRVEGDLPCPWNQQSKPALYFCMVDAVPGWKLSEIHKLDAARAWRNHYPRGIEQPDPNRPWVEEGNALATRIIKNHRDSWAGWPHWNLWPPEQLL